MGASLQVQGRCASLQAAAWLSTSLASRGCHRQARPCSATGCYTLAGERTHKDYKEEERFTNSRPGDRERQVGSRKGKRRADGASLEDLCLYGLQAVRDCCNSLLLRRGTGQDARRCACSRLAGLVAARHAEQTGPAGCVSAGGKRRQQLGQRRRQERPRLLSHLPCHRNFTCLARPA